MKRVVLKLFLRALSVCDVAVHDHQVVRLPTSISHHASGRFQDAPIPVLVAHPIFHLLAVPRLACLLCRVGHSRAIVGMDLLESRCGLQLFGGIPKHPFVGRAVVDPLPVRIDHGDHVGGVFADCAKQVIARHQLPPDAMDLELLVNGVDVKQQHQPQ